MKLFLDIETIKSPRTDLTDLFLSRLKPPGNMSKKETIDKWWAEKSKGVVAEKIEKTSLDGNHGEVISVSWALDDSDINNVFRYPSDSERDFLDSFLQSLHDQLGGKSIEKWIGTNIAEFDIPFLMKRFIVNDLRIPDRMPINPKIWDKRVYDVTGLWSGSPHGISQDELCFILGIDQKPSDINGANVGQHYIDGNYQKIVEYNNYDVATVRKIYEKMSLSGVHND